MSKTTVVYEGLLNPENVIASQVGDVMEERDELKALLEDTFKELQAIKEAIGYSANTLVIMNRIADVLNGKEKGA
jgi:hypothetical protein